MRRLLIIRIKGQTGFNGWDLDMGRYFSSKYNPFYFRAGDTSSQLIHLHFLCKLWSLTCVELRLSQQRRETQALWCTMAINASEEAKTIWKCQSQTNKHSYTNPVTSQLYALHLLSLSLYNKLLKFNLSVFVCFITLQYSSLFLLDPSISVLLYQSQLH